MPTPSDRLTASELEHYSRHLCLPEVGETGQLRLKRAKVLVVGLGGLGSPLAAYLACAGVGTLGLVDFDEVSASNLQRQILYAAQDVGRPKVWQAKARLEAMNPHLLIRGHEVPVDPGNVLDLLADYDLVADATDNFAARYLLNDAARLMGKPLVHASMHRFEGQLTVFAPGGPCYRCLYPKRPDRQPSCGDTGVLGVLPGILGTLQAAEVLKLIVGIGAPLTGRLLMMDALGARFTEIAVPSDPECPLCGDQATIRDLSIHETDMPVSCDGELEIEARDLLASPEPYQLVDVRETSADSSRIPGAWHVPFSRLADELQRFSPQERLALICWSGDASEFAVKILRGAGLSAWSVKGGIQAYLRAGGTVGQGSGRSVEGRRANELS